MGRRGELGALLSALAARSAAVVLENQHVSIGFDADLRLASLRALPGGREHIARPSDWWAAQLLHRGGVVEALPGSASSREARDLSAPGKAVYSFTWMGIPVGGTSTARVEAELQLREDDRLATVRLSCIAEGAGTVYKMVLSIAGLALADDAHVLQNNGFGQLWPAREGRAFVSEYPGDATYQAIAHYAASWGGGVYCSAEDPRGAAKTFGYRVENGTGAMNVSVLAPNAGRSRAHRLPYPLRLGVFDGDWYDAATIYRGWASSEAAWTRHRRTTPAWVYSTLLWVNSHWQEVDVFNRSGGDPEVVVPRVDEVRRLFGVLPGEMAVHWYEWDTLGYSRDYGACPGGAPCGFDTHYPAYLPARRGFRAGLAKLRDRGVRVFPYINGRIFDKGLPQYPEARPHTAKKRGAAGLLPGPAYEEQYGSNATFAVMCPATRYWQSMITDIASNIHRYFRTDGIYVDQIAHAFPRPCFDPFHGHPLGGGSHWVDGYRAMLEQLGRRTAPDFALMTESNAEPFVGSVDLFLTILSYTPAAVPFFPAVYGDRALSAGAFFYRADLDTGDFALKLARSFAWGSQLGWFALGGRDNQHPPMSYLDAIKEPRYGDQVAFVRRLLSCKRRANDWLQRGRMLRPPAGGPSGVVTSAWERDGVLLAIVVQPRSERLSLPLRIGLRRDYGMHGRIKGTQWVVGGSDRELGLFEGAAELTIDLPGYGIWMAGFSSSAGISV